MYLHRDDRELFRDVIQITAEKLRLPEVIVEKDYYVTMILGILANVGYPLVFKGGTSLSKAFGVIDRFSEDIDITFSEHLGKSRRKHLKYDILRPISEKLGMTIKNWDTVESDRDYNHYDYYYDSVLLNPLDNLPSFVKLETALMSYAFPTVQREISSYIYKALAEEEPKLLYTYRLQPFLMEVQALERTLADKIFAVCDYYMLGRASRNSRHLYDIYKLSMHVTKNDEFRSLIRTVRENRKRMGENLAPSAMDQVNIKDLIQRLCGEDFYKQDYQDNTIRLISDDIKYDIVRDFYKEFTEDLF